MLCMANNKDAIETVKEVLQKCKEYVEDGEEIPEDIETDVELEEGEICVRLHPTEENKIKVHHLDETESYQFDGTGQISHFANVELGFPNSGSCEPYSGFYGPHRQTDIYDFSYFK